jgi:hypothetical protein
VHTFCLPLSLLLQEPPHALKSQSAESIMASPVVGFDSVARVSAVLEVLHGTTHNGFPVLAGKGAQAQVAGGGSQLDAAAAAAAGAAGRLQGFVLRSQVSQGSCWPRCQVQL